MEAVSQVFGLIFRAFSATRYAISLVSGLVVLLYAGLWMTGFVPTDTVLANSARISLGLLLALIYLLVALTAILMWYLLVQHGASYRGIPGIASAIYRQTDGSGMRGFTVFLVVLILVALILSRGIQQIDRPVTVFLAVVALIPLLIDLIPSQRPRRLLVPRHGETLAQMIEALGSDVGVTVDTLIDYNRNMLADYDRYLNRHLNENTPEQERILINGHTSLPLGMFIEIPPGV